MAHRARPAHARSLRWSPHDAESGAQRAKEGAQEAQEPCSLRSRGRAERAAPAGAGGARCGATPAWLQIASRSSCSSPWLARGELDVPGVPQADRALLPDQRRLYKQPAQTWRAYGALFRRHSTPVMTPALLAALAQVEGSGNPARAHVLAAGRSRARRSRSIGRPRAPSACTRSPTARSPRRATTASTTTRSRPKAPWYALRGCWFNALYTRTVPSHAIELTSAYLDRRVGETLRRHPGATPTLRAAAALAALIHLVRRRRSRVRSCAAVSRRRRASAAAAHDVRTYLARVESMQRAFGARGRLAAYRTQRRDDRLEPSVEARCSTRRLGTSCSSRRPCRRFARACCRPRARRRRRARPCCRRSA